MATDPKKKLLGAPDMMPTATVRPDAPLVGGVPSMPNPVSSLGASFTAPPRLQPGQAAPDVNPQSAGTRFGNLLRDTRRDVVNAQVGQINAVSRGVVGAMNARTAQPRAALGFARDTGRAVFGMDPSPNAGQPIGGITAPQIATPYIKPPVNFALTHTDVPVRDPRPAARTAAASAPAVSFAGVRGGVLSAPTPTPAQGANAASRAAPGPDFGRVSGGVIRSPGTAVEGGRTLPMGAMVNGVPTFSDGTAGIPQTMSPDAMKQLAQERSISRADVGSGANVLASDVTGNTPSTDERVATLVRNANQPITGSRPSAEQFAAADRNAIAMRDPRSAAGIAARNLSVEAQYGRAGSRRAAAQSLQDLTAGANSAGLTAQQGENAQALTDAQGQNALEQVAAQGQNTLANTALENRGRLQMPRAGQQVTLADGTLGIQDPMTGAITASKLSDGTTAKGLVTRDDTATKRSNEIMDQISKNAAELAKSAMAPPGAPADWKPDPAAFREQAAGFAGLEVRADKSGKKYVNINGQVVPL